jgi:arylsulfatase A-like enzyme
MNFKQLFRLNILIFIFNLFALSFLDGLDSKDADFKKLSGTRPNIIMFLADDQSITDHTTYGNKKVPTPITQAFSQESLVFNNAFTGQAICAPSRSMLLTGLYPLKNGCYINHTAIRPGLRTLPSYLKELGYDVLLVGKSHLKPASQFPWTRWIQPVKKAGYPRPAISIDEVDEYLSKREKPFCLIIASEYPHGPYFKESKFKTDEVSLPPFQYDSIGSRNYFGRYYTSIAEKENEFKEILDLIDEHKLRDESIVFYADDHGMARGKFTVYKSGLNVAFMVRWPGNIKPGRTDALVSFADFVPTLIDLAKDNDSNETHNFDGKSLVSLFEGISCEQHEYLFGVGNSQGIQNRHIFPQRSIYDGRYNYIYNFNSNERLAKLGIKDPISYYFYKFGADKHKDKPEEELYDTFNDPFELNNLAMNSKMTSLKIELKEALFSWMDSQNDYLNRSDSIPFFKVWRSALDLDQQAPQFNYRISEDKVGTLKGRRVNPHKFGI